ncbi:hypothetical protein FGB62_388g02 [Gracilaria domingensis]|nr:hypothetical protein FGB62_388g02 [Gracilaria domingensis]
MEETVGILRASLQYRHVLQVLGNITASFGYFGSRDRWFRGDALRSGIGSAIRATLPGIIGPIYCDETDVSDAVAAMRGLSNVWSNLKEKEEYIVDSSTLIYTLSYKHIPVDHEGGTTRLSEARASDILQKLMDTAKSHGYNRFMLWCDGASSAGVRTDKSWVDIGLLPYAIYRTFRVNTFVQGESLMSSRLWLDLEKALSSLTCGMDVIDEYIDDNDVSYHAVENITGNGHKAMDSVIRLSSRIVQGDYDSSAVSWEADKSEIVTWAKRILMRSGLKEMNEALGWSGDPSRARQAKAVLMRVSSLTLRTSSEDCAAEVAKVCIQDDAREAYREGMANDAELQTEANRTEFWLRLLRFTEEEIGNLENEDLELTSYRFEEKDSGIWQAHVVSLQGDYYISMSHFENVEPKSWRRWRPETGVWTTERAYPRDQWLVTNSQVEKSGEIDEWARKMIAEMFRTRGRECTVLSVESEDAETGSTEDTAVGWFVGNMGEAATWMSYFAARMRERDRQVE